MDVQKSEIEKNLLVSNNISIHYRISEPENFSADSPAVILIHGVSSNLTRWTEFLKNTSIQSHGLILRLDLRGHAQSQTDLGVNMKNWCKDIIAILDEEQISKATIIGHSLGAQIAMNIGYQYPQRVSCLVLIDPVVPSALKSYMALGPYMRRAFSLLANTISIFRRLGIGKTVFPLRDLYETDKETRKLLESSPSTNLGKLYHSPSTDLQFIPISNYVRDMCEVLRPLPPLEKISAFTLTVLAKNPSVSHRQQNQLTMQRIPNNTIVTIDADHWPLTEKPVETRLAIERWCLDHWQTSGVRTI